MNYKGQLPLKSSKEVFIVSILYLNLAWPKVAIRVFDKGSFFWIKVVCVLAFYHCWRSFCGCLPPIATSFLIINCIQNNGDYRTIEDQWC